MHSSVKKDQRGIVAIIVTMILMIVITLIVLAFAKLSRQEQRSALDRELSTQAFYAAESGINFVKAKLQTGSYSGDYTTTCHDFTDTTGDTLPKLVGSPASNSYFTCLFVSSTQLQLKYSKTNAQIIFPYKPIPVGSGGITIYWDDDSGAGNFSGCSALESNPPSQPGGCNASVLRIEITTGDLSSSKTYFVYPHDSGSQASWAFDTTSTGSAFLTYCNPVGTPQKCSAKIINVDPDSYIRVKGIYGDIVVTAVANSGAYLTGAQAMIDATGRAADVERRIQVRVPISGTLKDPSPYAIEGTDKICKRFFLDGTNGTDNGPCKDASSPVWPD